MLVLGACEQLEDQNYDAGPERFYPPRVLNTSGYSGYKRAKLIWDFSTNNINTAKKIHITIDAPAINYSDTIIIDSLVNTFEAKELKEEVFYTFIVQTMDSEGNLSIINPSGGQTADVYVYGDLFAGMKNEIPQVVIKGAGICIVDFKNNNDVVLKADVSYNNTILSGKSMYYIEGLPEDDSPINITYSDYVFYKSPGGVLGLDAVKVPKSGSFQVSSSHKLTDSVAFSDNTIESIIGSITYDDWQNKTTSLNLEGAILSFKDLYLCRSLSKLILDNTTGESTTSPDVDPINFLIEEGILKELIIPDETIYDNIKSKIIDQTIISKE